MAEVKLPESAEGVDRGIPSLDASKDRNSRQSRGFRMAVILLFVILAIFLCVALLAKKFHTFRTETIAAATESKPNATRLQPLETEEGHGLPIPDNAKASGPAGSGSVAAANQSAASASYTPGTVPPAPTTPPQGRAGGAKGTGQDRASAIADANPLAFGSVEGGSSPGSPVALGGGGKSSAISDTVALANALKPTPETDTKKGASLEGSMKSTSFGETAASRLADPSLTMSQGTVLTCVLETALDSTVPGFTKCLLTNDVYSTDGRTVLAERGSTLVGQYESSSLTAGMNRIFLLWTRLETINGVVVQLDSPGVDGLGRSGVDGVINNHFWQRFGAGLLLSVVNDVTASAANKQGNQTVQLSSTTSEGQNAAAIALQHSVDIPPTLTKNQGGIVKVFVARDLYFGNVYGFRTASR